MINSKKIHFQDTSMNTLSIQDLTEAGSRNELCLDRQKRHHSVSSSLFTKSHIDYDELFLLSLKPYMKKLPDSEKIEVKKQICILIQECMKKQFTETVSTSKNIAVKNE